MTILTSNTLTRAAGLCAIAAGLLFIGVQINHPPLDVSFVTTTEYTVRQSLKVLFAALSLIGLTGMYLRQVKQTGVLGLLGYVLIGIGYLTILGTEVIGAYVLPSLAPSAPAYVSDVLAAATGGTATGDIGLLQTYFLVSGITFLSGGLIFGIALFRTGQRPRPVGCGTPGRWHRRNHRDPRPAADQRKGVRPAHRRRADRARLLAVARAAHPYRSARAQPGQPTTRPSWRDDIPAGRSMTDIPTRAITLSVDASDAARLAVVAAGGFAVVVLFQLALAFGAPLGAAAWGGEHSGQLPSNLRVASAFSAAFWSLAALTVLARGRIELSPIPFSASRWGTWALVGVLTVGTIANLASSSSWERFGWAPLVLALAFICLKLARTHGAHQ
jgi:hypothetical protein